MSEGSLRALVAHAVVDRELCTELLEGRRELVLARFELNEVERSALQAIRAETLQGFAAQLDDWMQRGTRCDVTREVQVGCEAD